MLLTMLFVICLHLSFSTGSPLLRPLLKDTGPSRRGRPRTAWMDNIKTWTGLPVEESVRMTEDRVTIKEELVLHLFCFLLDLRRTVIVR